MNGRMLKTTNSAAAVITLDPLASAPDGDEHVWFQVAVITPDVTAEADASETLNGGTDPVGLDVGRVYLFVRVTGGWWVF
jgi:hypothetical protein